MPLEAAIETYSYLITEIDKLGIGYITLMRYTDAFDPVKRGTPHDVIATYGPLIKNPKTSLVPTVGFTPEEGAQFVEKGIVAAIAYGRDWIVHPDFAQRIQDGKPLDGLQRLDMMGFYGHYPPFPHSEDLFKGVKLAQLKEDLKKGYSDYPDVDVQVADAADVSIESQ
jgi:2,4-dienoyl-CoA reductase-like NADH-dependent reductase (Old Yellow Enzyme family)